MVRIILCFFFFSCSSFSMAICYYKFTFDWQAHHREYEHVRFIENNFVYKCKCQNAKIQTAFVIGNRETE